MPRWVRVPGLGLIGLWLLCSAAMAAPAPEAARKAVETLHAGLMHIMENGPELGPEGRAAYIDAVVGEAYYLPGLTAQAVGPSVFRSFTPEEQAALVAAYRAFVVANYASRFKEPGRVRFETGEVTQGPGQTLVVTTRLVRRNGDPVTLSYVVTQTPDGRAGIIDVLYDGVSESARRRSEFAGLAAQGAAVLTQAIRRKAEQILAEAG